MARMISTLVRTLLSVLGTHRKLALGNFAPRQQIVVLQRSVKRPRLKKTDRVSCPGGGTVGYGQVEPVAVGLARCRTMQSATDAKGRAWLGKFDSKKRTEPIDVTKLPPRRSYVETGD